jgi:uncharacterized CHY-type Zn-finger protein
MKMPNSVEECVYFTNRTLGEGKAMCWVFKQNCPKCKKSLMGKPKDSKTGKAMIRAKEYVCPSCKYTVEKTEYEETLTASIMYTCPACRNKGEIEAPFKRKSIEGVKTLRVNCQKCKANIDITKKMKDPKKKNKEDIDDE